MKTSRPDQPWLEPLFFENQRKVTPAMLLPYAGQHIAWSWDGSRILGADADPEVLNRRLQQGGFDLNRVVFDYVDDPGVSNW